MSKQKEQKSKAESEKKSAEKEQGGFLAYIREWAEALIIAYLMAMFLRVFVVELFKIPSPSMTPTLLGTEAPRHGVGYYDINGDERKDMVLQTTQASGLISYDLYLKQQDGRYVYAGKGEPGGRDGQMSELDIGLRKALQENQSLVRQMGGNPAPGGLAMWLSDLWPSEASQRQSDRIRQRQDRILVAKFVYWFKRPKRGEIAVFKTPEHVFIETRPIYIKRVTGLPGETLSFQPVEGVPGHHDQMGRLAADGELVEQPAFFQDQRYLYRNADPQFGSQAKEVKTRWTSSEGLMIEKIEIPDDAVIMMGDNSVSSLDSRYWGPVELTRLRGRALFRYNLSYFPYINEPGFLN
ncbi:MAG: signal peptidase I [Candidatus Sumerlaeota bacterium]